MGKPLDLVKIHQYTGYQLYAKVRYINETSDVCLRYVVAVVLSWLRSRIGNDNIPNKIIFPSPDEAASNSNLELHQFHESCGYTINISVSADDGYWAMNLHEPDSQRDNRPAQAGRTIITDIALHVLDEEYIEIGIKTTILDPVNVPELPSSFRPAIVRTLLRAPSIELSQLYPIGYREIRRIVCTDDINFFDETINSLEQYMPTILFTYERKSIRQTLSEFKSNVKAQSRYGVFASLANRDELKKYFDEELASLPYDVDEFAHQTYGYGRTWLVDNNAYGLVRDRFNEMVFPGDIVFFEPLRYNDGKIEIYHISDYPQYEDRQKLFKTLMDKVLYYSKRKEVDWHGVKFERDVRDIYRDSIVKTEIQKDLDDDFSAMISELSDDNDKLKAAKENLTATVELQNEQIKILTEKRKQDGNGIMIQIPGDVQEAYTDEIRDLVIDSLKAAYNSSGDMRTRRQVLLEKLLSSNTITGEGLRKFERAKMIFNSEPDLSTGNSRAQMKKLGFEIEDFENNHHKIFFSADDTCYITVASTTSDKARSGKNSAAKLKNMLSVYSCD